jgi:hypothetical protein
MKALYRYPQTEYPYTHLIEENRGRGLGATEFELTDTGVFDGDRYFDVFAEYAKGAPNDILIRITVENRGPDQARVHLLPTLWFRNTWSWGKIAEECTSKPSIDLVHDGFARVRHEELGEYQFAYDKKNAAPLFTENETNLSRLGGQVNVHPYVKDSFHECVIRGNQEAVNPAKTGTKFAPHYVLEVKAGGSETIRLRLSVKGEAPTDEFADFENIFEQRRQEADAFYQALLPEEMGQETRSVARQAYAGLLWSKQFYHYVPRDWLRGDPVQPPPPPERHNGRNCEWAHLFNRDIISMPDKWEYPWFAAWDLAFHMIPFSKIDPDFAKRQLILFLREWYMHRTARFRPTSLLLAM